MNIISTQKAATLAGCNPSTIRYAIARGDIPALKIGKQWVIEREALQVWIDNPLMHKTGKK